MKQIEEFLKQIMGLHARTVGNLLVVKAVQARMRLLGLARHDVYLELLRLSRDELDALIEDIVVTETWFFRDREAFRTLAEVARHEWLPSHPRGQLRLLSVPCSTGEEPCSMSMALMDAGFPLMRYKIDAMDICVSAIAAAQRAEYGKNSFRGKDLGFREHHFSPQGRFHRVNLTVQNPIRFRTGNLLDDRCLPGRGIYDFIFCRNLLIYFDPPTQEKVLRKLRRLLNPAGVLFVGSAELSIAIKHGFDATDFPMSFSCRPAPPLTELDHKNFDVREEQPDGRNIPSSDLCRARDLADAGRFGEVTQICETYLQEHGANAEAYYLLGRAHDASGAGSQAGEFYRKALYLEPDHYDTLLRWAALEARNGDASRARLLQNRAERIKTRT